MWIWDSRTHQMLSFSAIQKCSYKLRRIVKFHQEYFILGIEAPDKIFRDFTNHYYNCTPNQYGYNYGKIIDKIEEEFQLINEMIENPYDCILHRNIEFWLKDILDSPLKRISFELGVISHYIADLYQPLHTDGKERFADETTVHKIYEADVRRHLDDFELITTKRRSRIYELKSHFYEQIMQINSHYDTIINNYYKSPNKVKTDRWEKSFNLTQDFLSQAMQNIANIFLTFEDKIYNYDDINYAFKRRFYLNKNIKLKNRYHIIKYSSGSVFLKKIRKRI